MQKVASTFNIMQVCSVAFSEMCFRNGTLPSRLGFASSMNKTTAHSWELRSISMCFRQKIRAKGFRHWLSLFGIGMHVVDLMINLEQMDASTAYFHRKNCMNFNEW
jgi:hypothetical protein